MINSVRNSVDVNTYAVPTELPEGNTAPKDHVGFPTTIYNPNLIIPAKLNQIIGYTDGFETGFNTGVDTTLSFSSSVSPDVNPNSNLLVDVNLTDNHLQA